MTDNQKASKIISKAEKDLGRLTKGQLRDLLMDNTSWSSNRVRKVVDYLRPMNSNAGRLSYRKNPSELLKSGEWTPAHAVRIRKGKLEILR